MTENENDDTKKATQKARDSLQRGFSDLFRAANTAASVVKNEAKKTFEPKKQAAPGASVSKAANDAGREVVRAAAEVATFLGASLSNIGKRAEEAIAGRVEPEGQPHIEAAGGDDEEWPKTREEYEKKYGRDGDDWPRSRKEYEEKYGRPPRKRGDDDDPGFRIA